MVAKRSCRRARVAESAVHTAPTGHPTYACARFPSRRGRFLRKTCLALHAFNKGRRGATWLRVCVDWQRFWKDDASAQAMRADVSSQVAQLLNVSLATLPQAAVYARLRPVSYSWTSVTTPLDAKLTTVGADELRADAARVGRAQEKPECTVTVKSYEKTRTPCEHARARICKKLDTFGSSITLIRFGVRREVIQLEGRHGSSALQRCVKVCSGTFPVSDDITVLVVQQTFGPHVLTHGY